MRSPHTGRACRVLAEWVRCSGTYWVCAKHRSLAPTTGTGVAHYTNPRYTSKSRDRETTQATPRGGSCAGA